MPRVRNLHETDLIFKLTRWRITECLTSGCFIHLVTAGRATPQPPLQAMLHANSMHKIINNKQLRHSKQFDDTHG
jgi:hypothetical protein